LPPSRRAVRSAQWLLWPVAALVTLGLVGDASYSAFVAKTSNTGNTFTAGSVNLADDDTGSALFTATNLKPGSTGNRCDTVTSSGTLPSLVKLYATSPATTLSLSSNITWTITQGTGGSYSSCSGFTALSSGSNVYSGTLAGFTGSATTYATGVGSWSPSGTATETRTFQFSYVVSATTPDSAQGGTASLGLTWEAQNA
jgi:hypothetical protein